MMAQQQREMREMRREISAEIARSRTPPRRPDSLSPQPPHPEVRPGMQAAAPHFYGEGPAARHEAEHGLWDFPPAPRHALHPRAGSPGEGPRYRERGVGATRQPMAQSHLAHGEARGRGGAALAGAATAGAERPAAASGPARGGARGEFAPRYPTPPTPADRVADRTRAAEANHAARASPRRQQSTSPRRPEQQAAPRRPQPAAPLPAHSPDIGLPTPSPRLPGWTPLGSPPSGGRGRGRGRGSPPVASCVDHRGGQALGVAEQRRMSLKRGGSKQWNP